MCKIGRWLGNGPSSKIDSMEAERQLLKVETVAFELDVAPRTVRELIAKGMIQSVLIKTDRRAKKGIRRISRAQLSAYIKRLEIEAR